MLAWPSVAWGLAHISSAELTDWIAYLKIKAAEREAAMKQR